MEIRQRILAGVPVAVAPDSTDVGMGAPDTVFVPGIDAGRELQ
ncbi:hypothetical protein [Frankia gtarii]|nr:hypothetical protein [Frankia gtarii]